MPTIAAEQISIDFPVVAPSARSLRNIALRKASRIGGRVIADSASIRIVRALNEVSFRISNGDRLAILGPNGSGKTTLIRTIAGIYEPSAGALQVDGTLLPMFDINLGFDEDASGWENIELRGLFMGLAKKEIAQKAQEIADYSDVGSFLEMPIRTYSQGMRLRLMFAIATSIQGDIVLMDEWISVGDADFQRKANQRLHDITDQSGILVLASHDLSLVRRTCNLGLVLEEGNVRRFGPLEEVLQTTSFA